MQLNMMSRYSTEARVAMPASSRGVSNIQGVPSSPIPEGTVAWIIMAPEMLARASRVLPWRTQMMAFMISGNSVATGESRRATTTAGRPSAGPAHSSWRTNSCEAPKMIAASLGSAWPRPRLRGLCAEVAASAA